MDSNKVYKDIVYLLYNILDNEKLRYELYKDQEYRDLYITLVDDLLTLEKDNEATFDEQQWATTYGKAIVVISQAKQRFERLENKSVEKIYEDYSKTIAFSMNSYEVKRDDLTKDKVKFSKDDVLFNGRLSDDTIKKYDDLAKQAKEEKQQKEEETIFLNNGEKVKPGDQQSNQNAGGFNPFGQGPNGQSYEDAMANMPQNPLQDPRFYPYTKKPKWMPALKITLGVIIILTAVLLIIASAFAMSGTVNLKDITGDSGLGKIGVVSDAIGNNKVDPNIAGWLSLQNPQIRGIDSQPKALWSHIISYIFYCIPAAYLGWACFKKPASTSEKYRISYWPVVFMILFFGLSIGDNYSFASEGEIRGTWYSIFSAVIDKKADGFDMNAFNQGFNEWWNPLVVSQHIKAITILMDVAIAFLCLSVVFGIILCILNPKTDKMKIQKAMNEYQRAAISAMQGIPYTMDQSIYEPDDDVIIKNKSKFMIWWENLFKKNKNKKNKKNDKKDK